MSGFKDADGKAGHGDILAGTSDPSTTEDGPVTPGWVEQELDDAFAPLPQRPTLATARTRYADCLAASRQDAEAAHDRCRRTLLAALAEDGVAPDACRALELRLEALEAELTART